MDIKLCDFDLGELASDEDFVNKVNDLRDNLGKISNIINLAVEHKDVYEKLTPAEQVEYDLFLAFTMNSLYWVRLRVKGIDPNSHPIKNELSRIRLAMVRHKEVVERMTLRPTLDKEAAKRFIRSGLWEPKQQEDKSAPKNKKIKFNDDGSIQ